MPLASFSYQDAIANGKGDNARWPRDPESQEKRLLPMCRPSFEPSFSFTRDDQVFTIGSCFARNIEKHLIAEGFNVAAAGFEQMCARNGVKTRPSTLNKFCVFSILNELKWALVPGEEFPEKSITEVKENKFLDLQLAPGLLPADWETMLGIRNTVGEYIKMVKTSKVIVVTLGLAEAWFDKEYGLYTNSMPLRPTVAREPDRFDLHVLEYNEIVECLRQILALLEEYGHPDFRMLLTVSPVALSTTLSGRDAMVANSYSKSVQRAAVETIFRENERVDYIPSYESITLSDRSLAWREDQAHVSDIAVRLNVLRMQSAYTATEATEKELSEIDAGDLRAEALRLVSSAMDLEKKGDIEGSNAAYSKAVEIDPEEMLARVRWGESLFRQEKYEQAREQMEEGLRLGGRSYNLPYLLGRATFRTGDIAAAETYLRLALEDHPDQAGVHFLLAKTLNRQKRLADAFPFYEKAHELAPENASMAAGLEKCRSAIGAV
ncbi:GSCFA domain-containing protein [uncultured Roseibium sp.]|uniref:GSCFA domain-containing protein n=1 Tax=uncultured Roseibium sp. TaxID=1936171 RepID=UPI0032175D35